MIRKILFILGGLVLLLILILAGIGLYLNRPLPTGESGPPAEELADKMLQGLNYEAYQELDTLSWTFPGGHHYVWDKRNNIVQVKWKEVEVVFSPDTQTGEAKIDGVAVEGNEKEKLIKKAWSFFANDSFWLVAPFKVRDPGTTRQLVQTEDGPALLVTYSSGGVTPGDSYLWLLDDNFRPKAWRMWVSIIPVGGLEISWEGWKDYQGVWLATEHAFPFGLKTTLAIHAVK